MTFAAGLAAEGFRPVAAIYSTFVQRAYDQVFHDICLQNLPVTITMDRAGLVGDDGPTHHGIFDLSYLRHLPGLTLMAPKDENELQHMLKTAIYAGAPMALRYPRGAGYGVEMDRELKSLEIGKGEMLVEGDDVCIVAIGSTVYPALQAAETLKGRGISAGVINARFAKPLDADLILSVAGKTGCIVTVEENALQGGFGSAGAGTALRQRPPRCEDQAARHPGPLCRTRQPGPTAKGSGHRRRRDRRSDGRVY